jgi:hypothetical protein
MSDAQQAYGTVLADLRARVAEHQKQIDSLNTAIQVLTLAAPSSTNGAAVPPENTENVLGRFYGMGYRKAILTFMADDPNKAHETATISDALQVGGMTTKGQSFSSNVSATLSDMVKKHGELEKTETGLWKLTGKGYSRGLGLIDPETSASEHSQQSLQ